ncbi:hypothetical protein GUITHDRAFT_150844 [Guillardia theta CCMP2712]|uniref:Uncharacterized protein n=1 Tax=Guillardia theta (strain CCMP2712) TaxID=905079 RepID=L1JUY4_GUITC|nr:hypothetical protein GUITHDRAFT_150844 [Guillardia theta CCMP2712]EKX51893.1 hypothetical protein GUITHDRAFT_150844 [Guillardia theta CCMP2712]|eukprot:XP_005838873.1 hypothetical protein GUITHDRAFT_150844 [Guillardia theta CCMP2712]
MDVQLGSKGLLFHAVHNEQTVLVDTPGEDERYDPETDGAYLTRWTIREDKEVGPMACVPACRWREAEVYNPHDVDILHEAARLVGLRHQAMADESRQFTESCKLSRLVLEGGIDNMVKAEEELKELKKMCMGLADRVETLKSYTKIKSERRVARQVAKESALLSPAELFEIEEPVQSPASVEDANDRTLEASTRHDGSHKSPEDEEELFEMEER